MKTKVISYTLGITVASVMLFPSQIGAQERLDESVAVDGRYKADVVRMERISSFPAPVRFSLQSAALPYAEQGVAASFAPVLFPLAPTGWNADRTLSDARGYLDLALGSWLNSSLSAGYKAVNTSSTSLGVRLQHNSTSLWRAHIPTADEVSKRYVYDETLGIDFGHTFEGVGRLSASAQYRVRCFNYYATVMSHGELPAYDDELSGTAPTPGAGNETGTRPEQFAPKAPTQTLNDVAFRLGWTPEVREGAMLWNLNLAYRYFGYRALYLPMVDADGLDRMKGTRENHVSLDSHLSLTPDPGREWNMAIRFDGLFYGGEKWVQNPGSYAQLELTPGYDYTQGPLAWRLGARLYFTGGAKSKDKKFSFFHIAPDVRVSWTKGMVGLYAAVGGGNRLNTLAANSVYDPYGTPVVNSSRPSYSPFDGSVGVSLRPFGGFRIGLEAGYKVETNVLLGGWYQTLLNKGAGVNYTFPSEYGALQYYQNFEGVSLHGGRLALNVEYDVAPVFSFSGSLAWSPQNGKVGWFNGYDRPQYQGMAEVTVRPLKALCLTAGIDWRGHRAVYAYGEPDWDSIIEDTPDGSTVIIDGGAENRVKYPLVSVRLRDMTDVHFGAAWSFSKRVELRADISNLLNRHTEILPGLPGEGICISGGLSVEF